MFNAIFTHPKIVLTTVGITVGIVLTIILMGAIVLKQRSEGKSFRDSILDLINLCWDSFWSFVFLPWTIFKGLFYTLNGQKNPDGSIKRANFSMTRTVFALSSFIMLTRLFTGGKTLEDVKAGPQVIESRSVYVYQPTSKNEKRKAKRQAKKDAKEKKKSAREERRARRRKRRKKKNQIKTRPYVYIKKIQSEPVEFYELLLFLIIAGLYYFRRDLNRGDRGNFLEKGIQMFAEAYAIKVSGGKSRRDEVEEEVKITETDLPPPPPPNHEK
jgi:hypothetical protein